MPSYARTWLGVPSTAVRNSRVCLLYLQNLRGYEPLAAGLAFSPLAFAVFLGSPLARRLLGKLHWTHVVMGAQAVCTLGLTLLACAPLGSPYAAFSPSCSPRSAHWRAA